MHPMEQLLLSHLMLIFRLDSLIGWQVRASFNAVTWNQEGRRCITGTQVGEFTQWEGRTFAFEHIIQVGLTKTCHRNFIWYRNPTLKLIMDA